MSLEKEKKKNIIKENISKKISITDKNLPSVKKHHKKSFRKSRFNNQIKVIPLLKPPNQRRKSEKLEIPNNKSGIIWDNKTIEEQFLDRKLHPRIKIDEPKTPYPDGDENDIYQEGINKLNEIKPTEELLNNVMNSLNEKNNEKFTKSKTKEFKKKAYENEYNKALEFYNENKEKFEELTGERRICLQNTLINKFHKEVRSLSHGKNKNTNDE